MEVVVALAVVMGGVVVILALLPGLIRRPAEARDLQVALQLPEAITAHLRPAGTAGLTGLAARLAELDGETRGSLRLVVTRDGTDAREFSESETPRRDQYYLIELYRFPTGSALAFDPIGSALPVHVRVSWPYRTDAADPGYETPALDRQRVSFNLVVNR